MNILLLGHGVEGSAIEKYFKTKDNNITVLSDFTIDTLKNYNFNPYDMVFRSPSVPPLDPNWTSSTKYFFDNCLCPIIGITGTKGKGTTCTILAEILKTLGKTVHLVGNIGTPAISELDHIQPEDIVVYEMSSFQLWDLAVSPSVAVILRIEPDHLNIHRDYEDYKSAKSHICAFQTESDYIIYFSENPDSTEIAQKSIGTKLPYPTSPKPQILSELLRALPLVGAHNRENAEAALLAAFAYTEKINNTKKTTNNPSNFTPSLSFTDFLNSHKTELEIALKNVKGLPHRLEYVRKKDGISFYDDNFSTTVPSLEVALNAFPKEKIILILGGRDKTGYEDLPKIKQILDSHKNLEKIILLGESGRELKKLYTDSRFTPVDSLESAVETSEKLAHETNSNIVLMSPAAASFDMFKNVYDRGEQFQTLVKGL